MPRYHFHLVDGHQLSDVRGVELSNDDAAFAHAREIATTWTLQYDAVRVVAEDGRELFRAPITAK